MQDFRWLKDLWLGKRLLGPKVERAASLLPQTTTLNIFNVNVGRVWITSIVGQVVTHSIGAVANVTKLQSAPTVGAVADLCGTVDITGGAVGLLYGISGTAATAAIFANALAPAQANRVVVSPGYIVLNCGGSDGLVGYMKWTVHYIPLDDGANVTAT